MVVLANFKNGDAETKGETKMKKGDYVETPRFLTVKIEKVFKSNERALREGYTEPTHYGNPEYHIRGKHTGPNMMKFAAIKKPA